MLRLSKLADYAVVVLIRLSTVDGCQTSPCVAAMTGLPEPTVAKVLKALTAAGLVISQRGARGGYRLAQALHRIPVSDVVAAIDGPVAITACTENGAGNCEAEALCPVRGRWDPVNDAVLQALNRITLADMSAVAPRPRPPEPRPPEPRAVHATALSIPAE
jgi:FeS assembly SUF system regulator